MTTITAEDISYLAAHPNNADGEDVAQLCAKIYELQAENERLLMANRDNNDWFNSLKADYETLKSWQESAIKALHVINDTIYGVGAPLATDRYFTIREQCCAILFPRPPAPLGGSDWKDAPSQSDPCEHDPLKPKCTLMHQFNQPGRTTCTVCKGTFWLPVTSAQNKVEQASVLGEHCEGSK